jgi:capsule polysaccharide export protein KpsE/RkpR
MTGRVPDGVPLKIDSTRKITHVSMPGMSPEQAAKVNQMLAKRPPTVTHMTVTKVRTEKLTAASFAPPAGYQKQEMRMPGMGGMSKPGTGAGTSSNKVPE